MKVHGRPVVKRRVEELRENPHQHELFDDLPDAQLDELAADMDANGQREPVEITGDNTIIDGHQRWRAAQKLKWPEVDVVVRHDLDFAGDKATEQHMIDVNLNRRQMEPLAIARLYKRLKEMERGTVGVQLDARENQDLRDRLAKRLGGKSGRTLDRYLKLLDAPREVRTAYSRNEVPMALALKAAMARDQDKAAIAAAIRGGRSAKAAIEDYVKACQEAIEAVERSIPRVPTTSTVSPSTGDTVEIQDDLGELQPSLDILQGAIQEVIDSELPSNRKLAAVNEATTVFQDTLIEHEHWCRVDGERDDLDEGEEE
jgi:ParB/RepB/Spo0J family partition protein